MDIEWLSSVLNNIKSRKHVVKLSSKLSPPLLHSYSMDFIRGHPIQKSMLKVCRTVHFFSWKSDRARVSDTNYLLLGNEWHPCSSQRESWLFCSSAEWCCWAAALKGQCYLAMPLHNVEWSCKDMWTSLQSKPPLLPALRDGKAKDLVFYKACFSFIKYRNPFGFQTKGDATLLINVCTDRTLH